MQGIFGSLNAGYIWFTKCRVYLVHYMQGIFGSLNAGYIWFIKCRVYLVHQINILVEITLIGLTPLRLCACPKQEHGSQTSYVVIFFVFNEFRWEMIVFVDIGGIVYHHCFNFFHNYNEIQIYHPSFRLWEVSLMYTWTNCRFVLTLVFIY